MAQIDPLYYVFYFLLSIKGKISLANTGSNTLPAPPHITQSVSYKSSGRHIFLLAGGHIGNLQGFWNQYQR